MTRRKKLGAGLIFATGFFVIVASIMSVVYCAIHGSEYGDNTWWLVPIISVTCKVSRGKNSAEPKSSEAPDTLDDLKMSGSKVSREKVKLPPKMYPGLDFTSRGGTVPATELDKNENIPNSKENHKVDSNMEHAQVEKDPTIGENEILPTRIQIIVKEKASRVEVKETPNLYIGIYFKDLGATKTVKWVVIVAISVAATMKKLL
ncbi:hypothetical protein BPOR_0476g00090 [Botrytis porri]|uniref:Uncharacterized protein n=1 Tax=Botrytis porri TaxID=87229 RepID=A0A4Z1KF66_9HELO|nr:hypothetical protein BPOR_0476g00090 [Botrytis porri]